MAIPAYVPTDEHRKIVTALAAMGTPLVEIAHVLGISVPTIRKYFHEDWQKSQTQANAKVAQFLFNQATHDNGPQSVTSAIFWLKCRAGWKDHEKVESGNIKIEVTGGLPMDGVNIPNKDKSDDE